MCQGRNWRENLVAARLTVSTKRSALGLHTTRLYIDHYQA